MEIAFKHNDPVKPDPIYIEQVFAEKPGGGLVENPSFDVPPTTAVAVKDDGKFAVIKSFRLVAAVAAGDTEISIAKGSGIVVGDIIGTGKLGVASTGIDESAEDKDVVTVTLGIELPAGKVLYQAKEASASAAEPLLPPVYVTGNWLKANEGNQAVRLINGANLRKETANISEEIEALLPTIKLV